MIIFTAASYMCAQSTGLVELIGWRFIQGVGGGALLSTSQAILFDAFKRKIVQWHQSFWDGTGFGTYTGSHNRGLSH